MGTGTELLAALRKKRLDRTSGVDDSGAPTPADAPDAQGSIMDQLDGLSQRLDAIEQKIGLAPAPEPMAPPADAGPAMPPQGPA